MCSLKVHSLYRTVFFRSPQDSAFFLDMLHPNKAAQLSVGDVIFRSEPWKIQVSEHHRRHHLSEFLHCPIPHSFPYFIGAWLQAWRLTENPWHFFFYINMKACKFFLQVKKNKKKTWSLKFSFKCCFKVWQIFFLQFFVNAFKASPTAYFIYLFIYFSRMSFHNFR